MLEALQAVSIVLWYKLSFLMWITAKKLEKHSSDQSFPLSTLLIAIFFPLSHPTFISIMNFSQLPLINDLTSQRKNTPTHLSRKFDELKTIFGFQKKNLAKCSALHFRGTHRSWCQGVWPEVSKQISGPVAAAERMSWSDRIKTPHQKAWLWLTIVLTLATSNLRNGDNI